MHRPYHYSDFQKKVKKIFFFVYVQTSKVRSALRIVESAIEPMVIESSFSIEHLQKYEL